VRPGKGIVWGKGHPNVPVLAWPTKAAKGYAVPPPKAASRPFAINHIPLTGR